MSAITRLRRFEHRVDENQDVAWACLRAYLGFALCAKSFVYLLHGEELTALMRTSGVPLASPALAELVAVVHLAGGLLLAFGLMTRWAALVQIPNVLGATVFVHWKGGFFASDQSLELTVLVLVLLLVFTAVGGGRVSVDEAFRAPPPRLAER